MEMPDYKIQGESRIVAPHASENAPTTPVAPKAPVHANPPAKKKGTPGGGSPANPACYPPVEKNNAKTL